MNHQNLKNSTLLEAKQFSTRWLCIPLSAKSFCSGSQKFRSLHKKDTATIGAKLPTALPRTNFSKSLTAKLLSLVMMCWLCSQTTISAQENIETPDTSGLLTPEQIDVIKPYQPVLAKAKRINIQANAPQKPAQEQRGAQTYYNPPKFIDATFEPPALKALGAKTQGVEPVKYVWLKAGYGYRSNPLVDFSAGTGLADQFNAGVQLKYDAAKGGLENQQHAHIFGRAFGRYVGNRVNINTTLKYENNTHHYYGYNHLESLSLEAEDVRQNASRYSATANIQNNRELKGGLDFLLGGNFSFTNDLWKNNNTIVDLNGVGKKYLKKNFLKVGANIAFSNYTIADDNNSDILLNVNPAFFLQVAGLEVGANLGLVNDQTYIYPKIKIEKYIVKDKIAVYAGWEKWALLNTYSDMLFWNPFLAEDVRILPSINEDRYGGLRGSLTERVTFNSKVKQQLTENKPVFVNDEFFLQKQNYPFDKLNYFIRLSSTSRISFSQTN